MCIRDSYSEVYDHEGNLLIDNREPEKTRVISEQTAWLLTSAMHDVVTGGTGSGANSYTCLLYTSSLCMINESASTSSLLIRMSSFTSSERT